jgi:hypothetical protein
MLNTQHECLYPVLFRGVGMFSPINFAGYFYRSACKLN